MNRTGLFILIAALVIAAAAYWYLGARQTQMDASAPSTDTMASISPDATATPPAVDDAPAEVTTPAPTDGAPAANDREAKDERRAEEGPDADDQTRSAPAQGYSQAAPPPPPPPPVTAPPAPPKPEAEARQRAAAAAPAKKQEEIPIFPWPVPKATAMQEVPRNLIIGKANVPTFGTVAERISAALDRAGYGEHSYYALADGHGVAIATQLEQINDDGSPALAAVRFQEASAQRPVEQFSLTNYTKALFTARTGRFRIIVFTLSGGITQDTKSPSEDIAMSWVTGGQTHLPVRIASIPFDDHVTCTALIYEFEKKDFADAASFVPAGKLNAMSHLVKAGIWTLLGK